MFVGKLVLRRGSRTDSVLVGETFVFDCTSPVGDRDVW
jgi:hypothetical protein